MEDDVLTEPLPIAGGPTWGTPSGAGLGVEVDESKLARYSQAFEHRGQYLPYDNSVLERGAH